jgi:hypothetical protein
MTTLLLTSFFAIFTLAQEGLLYPEASCKDWYNFYIRFLRKIE